MSQGSSFSPVEQEVLSPRRRVAPLRADPSVIVLEPGDVVFAEIVAPLNFDENQIFISRIFNSVRAPDGDVDSPARLDIYDFSVESYSRQSLDDHPVFCPPGMLLIAEPLARKHFYAFDLVAPAFVNHGEATPRTLVIARRLVDLRCFLRFVDHLVIIEAYASLLKPRVNELVISDFAGRFYSGL